MVEREKYTLNISVILFPALLLNKNCLIFSLYSGLLNWGFYSAGAILQSILWKVSAGLRLRGSGFEPKTQTTIYGIFRSENYQHFEIYNIFNSLQSCQRSVNLYYVKLVEPPPP
jgi:hypothetical protein